MTWRKQFLVLLLFILFLIETSVLPWFMPQSWIPHLMPNLVFVCILFVAVYRHRYAAMALGVVFGMLHDVVFYGAMLGPYSFTMGFTAYLLGLVFQLPKAPLPVMLSVVMLGSFILDSMLFGIYTVFNFNEQSYDWALVQYIVPDLLLRTVFALIVYVPIRRQFDKMPLRAKKEDNK
ncbi:MULTISPECIES: rod shape-determining protein MreD [Saccharibacillus]|uniref:Rod shape-determining protein MreD n=1 Tax=Saccharibacillus brassicae TaxID=2583377 RepID=A0A4Y6UUS5_SACBS|nr:MULTISPECIES: rod shape-determining protein MreD [Saccharibacillus]MWJ31676.1 rod shape-determining protein MreD [Saccharibacillus sp. WB 17]QDH20091.1 rod shape-determining protein MreD [Saccharibacillus brassicae]